jgi:hypothetical protein
MNKQQNHFAVYGNHQNVMTNCQIASVPDIVLPGSTHILHIEQMGIATAVTGRGGSA